MHQLCLNCNEQLNGKYCIHCGQAATTHRFTLKLFFTQDFTRVIFYIHRGFFFTLKELFTRPGHSIREYIGGKRVQYLNYFTFLVVILLIFSFVENASSFNFADLTETDKAVFAALDQILRQHSKVMYISIIPFYALCTWLIFNKAQQNYAEHLVLNTFRVSAFIIINTLVVTFASLIHDSSIISTANNVVTWIFVGYGTWFYYQYFSPFYINRLQLLLNSFVCAWLPALLLLFGFIGFNHFLTYV